MADLTPTSEKALSRGLLDVLIRAGLIAVLAIACYQIFSPFLDLMLWSLILAVTLYPLQGRLKGMLGNKEGRTATLIVVIAIAILIVPDLSVGHLDGRLGGECRDHGQERQFPYSAAGRFGRRLAAGGQTSLRLLAAGRHRLDQPDAEVRTADQRGRVSACWASSPASGSAC